MKPLTKKPKAGDIVRLDDGFTCCPAGEVMLHYGDKGRLFFACDHGQHYIDGQLDSKGNYVGIYKRER